MERLKVITEYADAQHNEWKKGQVGMVDGYVRGGNDTPLAVVVIKERLVLIPFSCLKVVYKKGPKKESSLDHTFY